MNEDKKTRRTIIIAIVIIVIILAILLIYALLYRSSGNTNTTENNCDPASPPLGINVVTQQTTDIKVSWLNVANANYYIVYIGTIPGFSRSTAIQSYTTAGTEIIISNQILGRTYYIRVETINNCGNTGILSTEHEVTLGFPDKFRIVNRNQPSLALTIAPDFQNIIVDASCSGLPGDDLCIWTYDTISSLLTNPDVPGICMTTFPLLQDPRVKYNNCNSTFWYNWFSARQWNYDPEAGSLCNPQNGEGLNCVKVNGSLTPGTPTVAAPYDATTSMQWDIVGL